MTKLEEKLKELGYIQELENPLHYIKIKNGFTYFIRINLKYQCISLWEIIAWKSITEQKDIDNLQQAFNVMQQDLEELKKYEI